VDAETLGRVKNAVATAQAMLEVAVAILEQRRSDGRVQSLHGERDVGADAGRGEDPDRRPGDTSRGRGRWRFSSWDGPTPKLEPVAPSWPNEAQVDHRLVCQQPRVI
jgi:hypothetical protein